MSSVKLHSNPLKTLLVIVLGFLILYLIFSWIWALYLSVGLGIFGLLSEKVAFAIEKVWFKLTWVLSLIIPNILLALVFFVVLTPVALLSRIIGNRDPLMLRREYFSTFKEVHKEYDSASFEHPW